MADFWQTSGYALLEPTDENNLRFTDAFLQAYFLRPEVHPIEESCDRERALHAALMDDPRLVVDAARLRELKDPEAVDNYRLVLGFRDHLVAHDNIEAAYLSLVNSDRMELPPVFLDQLVHVILRHILSDCDDPVKLRAAEVFFRDQNVNLEEGRIMLADDEIVEMYSQTGAAGGLGQLLVESDTPIKSVELDVLDDDNAQSYWERSNQFDMVVDFRFTEPALDAFARVVEAWIAHFTKVKVRVQPRQKLEDEHWTWHIGLDAEATGVLNGLYEGKPQSMDELAKIIALFRLDFDNQHDIIETVRGKPVYLGLAVNGARKLKMKPQNLLTNLPLSKQV